jgi:hypothetical protein
MPEQFKNIESIKIVKNWLDDISYSSINKCLFQYIEQQNSLLPDYNSFINVFDRINPYYAFIFSVFRFGMPAEIQYFNAFMPKMIVDVMLDTGLLVRTNEFAYQMPQTGIVPICGMYFVVGLPVLYPTVSYNNRYKPINQHISMIIDEMISTYDKKNSFLETGADYGIMANVAIMIGYSNVKILPCNMDYKQLICVNLLLNNHKAEIISDNVDNNSEYDYIAGSKWIDIDMINKENDHTELFHLFPEIDKLSDNGQAAILLESFGSIHEIFANKEVNPPDNITIKSIIIDKMPCLAYVINYNQNHLTSWEKRFELKRYQNQQIEQYIIENKNDIFVFKQLLKINKCGDCNKEKENFVLYPFYNPKYSDPLYNYASLTI